MTSRSEAPPSLRGALEALHRPRTRAEVFVRLGDNEQLRRDAVGSWERRSSRESGVACRVAVDGKVGFAAASGEADRAGAAAAAAALDALAPGSDPLPPRDMLGSTAVPPCARPSLGEVRQAFAEAVAAHLLATAPEVELVELRVLEGRSSSWLATSEGFVAATETAGAAVELVLAPREGPWRLFRVAAATLRDLRPGTVAERAAGEALLATRGHPPRRQLADVVLAPAVAAPLVVALAERLAGAASAHDVFGHSRVSPSWHLVDERPGPFGLMPAAFDGEGLPARRIELVREGRRGERLGTWADAQRFDLSPGGAVRPSYRQRPFAGPANLVAHPVGPLSQAELLRALDHGYYLSGPAGGVELEGESGAFRLRSAAVAVHRGRPVAAHPLVELRGSLRRLLAGLDGTGTDLESFAVTCAVTTPSLLVRRLEIA